MASSPTNHQYLSIYQIIYLTTSIYWRLSGDTFDGSFRAFGYVAGLFGFRFYFLSRQWNGDMRAISQLRHNLWCFVLLWISQEILLSCQRLRHHLPSRAARLKPKYEKYFSLHHSLAFIVPRSRWHLWSICAWTRVQCALWCVVPTKLDRAHLHSELLTFDIPSL